MEGLVGGMCGARGDVEGDDGDVVGLAEVFCGLRDVACRLVADLLGALEAEEFTVGVGGFDDTVGEEDEAVTTVELEGGPARSGSRR